MPYQIRGDVHTHTLFSRHAYSTITENVAAAKAAGLELLGSADHFGNVLYDEPTLRGFQFFCNQRAWPRDWDGVTVLRACEADITGLHGELYGQDMVPAESIIGKPYREPRTLFERVTDDLDYVVASVHNGDFADGASLAATTAMYVGALENPKVFILGHTGRAGVPFDIDEVLTCAKERHKLIEINEHTLEMGGDGRSHAVCRKIAERCAELGVGISVSTDAHLAYGIGKFPQVETMLDEIRFPEELIVDRGREPFLRGLAEAGVCDLTALL